MTPEVKEFIEVMIPGGKRLIEVMKDTFGPYKEFRAAIREAFEKCYEIEPGLNWGCVEQGIDARDGGCIEKILLLRLSAVEDTFEAKVLSTESLPILDALLSWLPWRSALENSPEVSANGLKIMRDIATRAIEAHMSACSKLFKDAIEPFPYNNTIMQEASDVHDVPSDVLTGGVPSIQDEL